LIMSLSPPNPTASAPPSDQAARPARPAEDLASPRVLIIDDTPAIHEDFRKILVRDQANEIEATEAALFGAPTASSRRTGFELDSAYQGQEGLALVQKALAEGRPYALAFVDIRMPPGWDGIETVSRLWAADPDLQVVICTAYSDYSWDETTRRLGETDSLLILKKPFDNIEVLQLAHALTKKWLLTGQSQERMEDLDAMVARRTQDLGKANETLLLEIAERKRAEQLNAAFSNLGQRLSAAKTAREAALNIVDVADQLLGWDACFCDLFSPQEGMVSQALHMDIVNGRRAECRLPKDWQQPSPTTRRAIEQGGQLILRNLAEQTPSDLTAFGDTGRRSASLIFVPIRNGADVNGVLSIQSYAPGAYDRQSLALLQTLADHCGGALERIRAQEALSGSEANYRLLVERSPDGILVHRDGTFVYANPAALQLLHAQALQDLLGRTVMDIVPAENRECIRLRIQHALERGPTPLLEQKILRLDGTPIEAEVMGLPCTFEGKPAVQTIMRDITERKKAEENQVQLQTQLRQSQKMEAIGQLAGGVAHDFNNLLAVIRGNAELAVMHAVQASPETRECLKQVQAAADRAANLTRQLLAFGRKQIMQAQPLSLNDVVGNLTKMLKRVIGENVQLQCSYAARLPLVQADVGMLEQVLVNLVVNARDAMPRGGQVVIATESVHLDAACTQRHPEARAGQFVLFSVSDTGTGIAPEHLPRIFEPFFTTKEVGKGTGLGLATVYGIVRQHQGWIEISSQVGVGSTFKIFLPALATAAAPAAPAAVEAKPQGGTEKILLVEDDDAVRMLTRRLLQNYGYRVCEAASGRDALALWPDQSAEIDLLLTDVIMPHGVTGRELAERLRRDRPGLKIVFMSGYSGDVLDGKTDFVRKFNSRFLPKPCTPHVLLRTLRQYLDEPVANRD
jgi:PAS domain S-box-containing protein